MTGPSGPLDLAYQAELARQRLATGKVAALLVTGLMPVGFTLDWGVYGWAAAVDFLWLRLACAALTFGLWRLHFTDFARRHPALVGLPIPLLPAAAICAMIARQEGWNSPYYAGLNLIILAVNVVVHWQLRDTLLATAGIVALYVLGCLASGLALDRGLAYNNLYFILLTVVIVATGNHFYNTLRRREFMAREELARSREELTRFNAGLRASQAELARANDELVASQARLEASNHELQVREHELERTNERLRELDELKGRFFANISHELRTPLTLLLAPLEALRGHPALVAQPTVLEQLTTMSANGMRLLKLINDLLELVRLDSGTIRLNRSPVELESFLGGLLDSIRSVTRDKNLTLSCVVAPDATHVNADSDRLEKVFLNLLFNAVKFTPAGGTISLQTHRDGDSVVIDVTDTGMGIHAGQLPHIFDRFWQADSSAQRKFQGAGIGLALVKELVEAHGGNVTARSEPGAGTSMSVRLPPATAPARPTAPAPAPAPANPPHETAPATGNEAWLAGLYKRAELFAGITPLREALRPWSPPGGQSQKPRLLLADDEPDMLRFLKTQLSEDYEVIEAVDGAQAVSHATQYLPDIIVTDMMMPEKDGLQVCRELRAQTSTRTIPVLMLTARADDETKLRALAAGAGDYLPKPFSTAELRLRLKNLVDAHQLQKALTWQNRKLEATIEQLQETELQLVQSEKLAALGRLSAGIIHEINNPLNYALTAMHLIRKRAPLLPEAARPDFTEAAEDVEDGLRRVAGIVSDLRSFTHNQAGPLQPVQLATLLPRTLRFFAAEVRDQVEIIVDVPAELEVQAHPNRLIQVLINLIQNALDAMKGKTYAAGESPALRIHAGQRGSLAWLALRDNGPGIPPEVLPRVFDPFFTTKEVGAGMGLGLSICHRIMTDAGGQIRVDSRPGEYTEFILEFPSA